MVSKFVVTVHSGSCEQNPDNKDHGANVGPNWVLSAPGGPHVGPMNLAIRVYPSPSKECKTYLKYGFGV